MTPDEAFGGRPAEPFTRAARLLSVAGWKWNADRLRIVTERDAEDPALSVIVAPPCYRRLQIATVARVAIRLRVGDEETAEEVRPRLRERLWAMTDAFTPLCVDVDGYDAPPFRSLDVMRDIVIPWAMPEGVDMTSECTCACDDNNDDDDCLCRCHFAFGPEPVSVIDHSDKTGDYVIAPRIVYARSASAARKWLTPRIADAITNKGGL